jgi:hypothetical protein
MNDEQVTSLWYDTTETWGVTVDEAQFVTLQDTLVAFDLLEDFEF